MKKLFILVALMLLPGMAHAQALINWSTTTAQHVTTSPVQIIPADPNRVCFLLQNTSTTPVIATAGTTCNPSPPNGWVLNQLNTLTYCNFTMLNAPPRQQAMNTQSWSLCVATGSADVVWQIAH